VDQRSHRHQERHVATDEDVALGKQQPGSSGQCRHRLGGLLIQAATRQLVVLPPPFELAWFSLDDKLAAFDLQAGCPDLIMPACSRKFNKGEWRLRFVVGTAIPVCWIYGQVNLYIIWRARRLVIGPTDQSRLIASFSSSFNDKLSRIIYRTSPFAETDLDNNYVHDGPEIFKLPSGR
jgi:hypothetical protein